MTIDPTTTFDLTTTETQPVVSQTADMKALFDEAVLKNSQPASVVNVPRPPGVERPKQLVSRPQSHLLVEKTTVSKPTELSQIMLRYGKYILYWNGQLVWTPALGLYLCVFLCVHVTSNVELRNYVISRQIVIERRVT